MKHSFDVIVVGGGHAGCEAAHAAARSGADTCLVTHAFARIGEMSCNPAIGGLGKGHIVREIDALGGVMGRVADYAGIQFRLLNRRKGPAVQGPRAQADRKLYREAMQAEIASCPNLTVIEGEVVDFEEACGALSGVVLLNGAKLSASAVVLTTGTFLGGVIHIGEEKREGGRIGDNAATRLASRIHEMDLPLGRLKTGTPPRLDGRTINWDILDRQDGDDNPTFFSFDTKCTLAEQISCGVTHTNEAVHEIIERNLSKSAIYGGHIGSSGPRYCPSIEDKIVRFADKDAHQIFLEPESLSDDLVYPNGISTSLPADVQLAFVRKIKGLESADIVQPGYAIEYDYVDPRCLSADLSVPQLSGLFLAGQINGTTGYEEAAGQGLVAGLNAASYALGRDAVILGRDQAYIGVMIDDLTTNGVTEPYRMFTSRAEYRLSLRADNADQRLTPLGIRLGIVDIKRAAAFDRKMSRLNEGREALSTQSFSSNELAERGLPVSRDGQRLSLWKLLSYQGVEFDELEAIGDVSAIDAETREQLAKDAQYSVYLKRQKREIEAMKRDGEVQLPRELDYASLPGLSAELVRKLDVSKPETLAHAGRIEGMTPAALALILSTVRKMERQAG